MAAIRSAGDVYPPRLQSLRGSLRLTSCLGPTASPWVGPSGLEPVTSTSAGGRGAPSSAERVTRQSIEVRSRPPTSRSSVTQFVTQRERARRVRAWSATRAAWWGCSLTQVGRCERDRWIPLVVRTLPEALALRTLTCRKHCSCLLVLGGSCLLSIKPDARDRDLACRLRLNHRVGLPDGYPGHQVTQRTLRRCRQGQPGASGDSAAPTCHHDDVGFLPIHGTRSRFDDVGRGGVKTQWR